MSEVTADNLTVLQILQRIHDINADPVRFSRSSHELIAECDAALAGNRAASERIAAALNERAANAARRKGSKWP